MHMLLAFVLSSPHKLHMIFCSWNIKGLNQPFKLKELKPFLAQNKMDLLGCLETKIKYNKRDTITMLLGKEWTCTTDYNADHTRRVWICWKHQQDNVTIVLTTPQLVHCYVEGKGSSFVSFMISVYGYNTTISRKDIWEHLGSIHNTINDLWVILGGFNTGLSTIIDSMGPLFNKLMYKISKTV